MVVVLADDLDEEVEAAGGGHDVVDLGHRRRARRRPASRSPSTRMPIIACRVKPDLERVGDGDDLHDLGVEQALHALADGGLGQADGLADGGVGAAGRPPGAAR